MRTSGSFITICAIALTACGGTTENNVSAADVATYQDLSRQIESAVSSYRDTMLGPSMTMASCQAVHDGYDATVRPWVSQMMKMSGGMDGFMDAHQGSASADFQCMATAMMDDLDAHRHAACQLASLSDDRTEAARHAQVMLDHGSHIDQRCAQMTNGMDGRGYMWTPMMMGCASGMR